LYRFKAFDSADCDGALSTLEAAVNAWMEEEHPRIRHMCQSVRGEHIVVSFVYENSYELEQRISSQVHKGNTGAFTRIFDNDALEDRPTNPRIPATPPPIH